MNTCDRIKLERDALELTCNVQGAKLARIANVLSEHCQGTPLPQCSFDMFDRDNYLTLETIRAILLEQ